MGKSRDAGAVDALAGDLDACRPGTRWPASTGAPVLLLEILAELEAVS